MSQHEGNVMVVFKSLDFIENGSNSMQKDEKRLAIALRVTFLYKNPNIFPKYDLGRESDTKKFLLDKLVGF